MIIFTDNTGQLGNQLFEFSTFIANALKNDTGIINLYFEKYRHYFEGSANNQKQIRVTYNSKKIDSVFRQFFQAMKKLPGIRINGEGKPFDISGLNTRNRIKLKEGSWFTDFDDFYRYQSDIKKYFTPVQSHQDNIGRLISGCRKNCDVLVGIHIRGGDYKDFLGGQFYFERSVYYEKMKQIEFLFSGQKVGFLVCSNEHIDHSEFKGLKTFQANNHFIEDMYSLAECDYILGPPSTYTMWASFYGNRPLQKLRTRDQIITKENFVMDYGY